MRTVLAVTLAIALSSCAGAQQQTEVQGPWEKLNRKTGWILLGLVDDRDQWATEKSFELLEQAPPVRHLLPNKGDRIRILIAQDLVILDYGISGEEKAELSPTTRERLSKLDYTRLVCGVGAVMKVAAIELGAPSTNNLRQVWVRVTPDAI